MKYEFSEGVVVIAIRLGRSEIWRRALRAELP